ncbi:MAG: 30S ribosomal protein S24e [Infirmifilum sp.]
MDHRFLNPWRLDKYLYCSTSKKIFKRVKALPEKESMSQGDIKVIKDRFNKLIPRQEIIVEINHFGSGTPSRQQIAERVKNALAIPANKVVVVRKAVTAYGSYVTRALLHVYDSIERAKAFEPKYILKRNGLVQEQQATQQTQ